MKKIKVLINEEEYMVDESKVVIDNDKISIEIPKKCEKCNCDGKEIYVENAK